MAKKRVYELAKDLGLESKELISCLEKIGIAVRSHLSTLDDSEMERILADILSPEPLEVRVSETIEQIKARTDRETGEAREQKWRDSMTKLGGGPDLEWYENKRYTKHKHQL